MKTLGLTINAIIVIAVLIYILYIGFADDILPDFINDLFNNFLFRLSVLILIIMLAIGHKDTGIGGPMIGIMVAIAYVITSHLVMNAELFYVEEYFDEEETPQEEEYIDENIEEKTDTALQMK